ncbi:ester cyclase [Escherichia coli]|uniref:ester cyclase n=1 Tax=Escherichia coli TaxID=562 RepID=UPI0024BDE175|nr:ester cyclase [Escherichia coli]
MIEENKYAEVKNLCHPDFKFYSQVDTPLNSEQFIVQEKGHMDAFPGFTMRIHEIFARDDKVACYLIFEGVQTREFLGHPASGRQVRFSLMFMITLKDGKYIEKRAHYNRGQFGYRKLLYVKLIFYHFWFFWKRNILDVKTVMRGH